MKRFHVHVSVGDLEQSIRFYSTLFGADPAVTKPDYAKWMLEDPRVNFAISTGRTRVGINHLGLQTDSDAELDSLNEQLQRADVQTAAERDVTCCYARSNKYWVKDPAGVAWETFHSLGAAPIYGESSEALEAQTACGGAACGTSAQSGAEAKAAACCG
ncbi:MAG TPA: ArsI/CadI family heavy metal resistance metalloenzyme [Burkholderiaceae bacterium]|nr:ArsI/CadI family heavy metal resistance metalloenzyme [Burkholderiaceae bacterium]